jgi:acyl-CoA synthetase (NDP forming)
LTALAADVRPHRVGVVTTTGGGSAMSVDQMGIRGVTVQAASEATQARLRAAGIHTNPGRVLDLTLAGTKYEVMKQALDILLTAPEFDLVLAVVGSSARFNPQLAVKPIIDSVGSAKPLAAMIVPEAPEAIAALTAAGVPCFRSPEACGDAIAATFARRMPSPLPPVLSAPAGATFLREDQAYAVLKQLGLPHAPCVLWPLQTDAGESPALSLAYPVAVKVCSAAIPHKTDVGGVVLGVANAAELRSALATLRSNLAAHAPDTPVNEVLVQSMCKGSGEVLLGYRFDPDAGPVVMLAAGGIWAEVMRDRSLRLAPVTLNTAREMVSEVRFLQSLTGLRGRSKGDLEALARAVVALSQLALRPDLKVAEAEINPLMVMPEGQGVLAVDALVLQA